jgi:CBS domain-containing protein
MTVQRLLKSKGAFVPVIHSDTTLQDVIDRLEFDEDFGTVVVTDGNKRILGIMSERDIARGLKTYGRDVLQKPVRHLMTRKVVTCDAKEPFSTVLGLMEKHKIPHVPITRDGVVCGIIDMHDIVKYRLDAIDAVASALKAQVAGHAGSALAGSSSASVSET